ncbi:hypothetical protein L1887_37872 [Cichorium endivia]|nr:hypothetical protein L1887_37872 [Cichorium endivia]
MGLSFEDPLSKWLYVKEWEVLMLSFAYSSTGNAPLFFNCHWKLLDLVLCGGCEGVLMVVCGRGHLFLFTRKF